MNKIEFNFAIDSENKDHMLIIGEMFLKLAGSGTTPVTIEKPKKPVKAEPVKAEPVKAEPVKAEPVKAEPETNELTIEKLRARGYALATSKPAAKEAIKAWLDVRNIKGVPAIPKELFDEYNEFLNTL
jgi:hypothetical protein